MSELASALDIAEDSARRTIDRINHGLDEDAGRRGQALPQLVQPAIPSRDRTQIRYRLDADSVHVA